ncbi:MAG: sulfurtransferase [Betaproteobacteria bacterium]|nr:sulfurtransferase [Betaproteobacteria bacterium]
MAILNLAAYQFTAITDTQAVQRDLLAQATGLGIKGTILVTPEGLNAFLAGPEGPCRAMLACLRAIPGFAQLQAKESWSDTVPFQRLKVKCKNEIIRMDHPMIQPEKNRAPAVDAQTLARWLDQGHDDQGRPVVMLDTRNDFEVDYGRFANAIDWRIQRFTQFPQAVRDHRDTLAGKTVVSYCTGGIRCEKAALFMQAQGLDRVLQLEGGILKYFEETDGRHWQGSCFVFDAREALDADLQPAPRSLGPSPQLPRRPASLLVLSPDK